MKSKFLPVLLALAVVGPSVTAHAQSTPAPAPAPAMAPAAAAVVANPADVQSVDAIIGALYDVISGPAGKKRDWDRLRSLFAPEGRMVVTGPRPNDSWGTTLLTPNEYIGRVSVRFERDGFFEVEVARTSETFGQIAHVFSTYESRHTLADPKPFQRGINSLQLMNDGKRWWIVSLVWLPESDKNPLPERYLKRP